MIGIKCKNYVFVAVIFLVSGSIATAQLSKVDYQAYLMNDLSLWERVIAESEPNNFDRILALYGCTC